MGHKYSLSVDKLARKKTIGVKRLKDEDKFLDENRTFFCSELCAKAFKVLGIMENDDVSCALFYPHHFTALGDDGLNLTKGTTIGSEM